MTLRNYLNRRSMQASLVMLALIVASGIYASKQGWDGTWKPVAGFVWLAAIVLSVVIMQRTRCPKWENGLVTWASAGDVEAAALSSLLWFEPRIALY